jgi:hypothetical protein
LKKEQPSGDETPKPKGRQPKSDQAKSVSSRRQHNRRDQAEVVDEEAFKDFDYRVHNQDEWTTERVQELEIAYWKSLNFSNPMYGADMPGSLFDDTTKEWNVAKLENLLDVLGQNIPGVNTAYLYLGMWKASFAWHLEDVDLYSINYIHFGAPKQWYSISQEDARRFEAAMRSKYNVTLAKSSLTDCLTAIWPNDAKNCDQFLRHKTYLISPSLLQSQFNIRVNRLVHHEGEFVITFPYGYHSGYNLGYNCAESVNFATDAWLEYGKVARKCNCEADSVWVDVQEIERKLRGEPTPEYYEETDDEEDDEDDDEPSNLPTPPGSVKGKPKRSHKRKRDPNEKDSKPKVKKLRIKLKAPAYEPCILCPNDSKYEELLSTDSGQQAHRRCAIYTPETYIVKENTIETIVNIAGIDKARLELKCNYCRNKKGSVFQCSQKKCTRAYHATCAAQAGVLVDRGVIPVYGEDGTEYTDIGNDFRCRIHRGRRGKYVDGAALEEIPLIKKTASKLPIGEVVQMQYLQGDIFAGVVLENRKSEETLLIEVLPKGYVQSLMFTFSVSADGEIVTKSRLSISGYLSLTRSILNGQYLLRMRNRGRRSLRECLALLGRTQQSTKDQSPRNYFAIHLCSGGKNLTHAKHSTTLNRSKLIYRSLGSCGSILANIPPRQRLNTLATWLCERTMLVLISWRLYESLLSRLPHLQYHEDLTQHHILSTRMPSTPRVRTMSLNNPRH